MNAYQISTGVFGIPLFIFYTDNPLHLRRICRHYIGLRRSARMRYKQVGTNSFIVYHPCGWWPVLQIWRIA